MYDAAHAVLRCIPQTLSQHVAAQLAANSPQAAQAAAGKEWVRGWDDYNK